MLTHLEQSMGNWTILSSTLSHHPNTRHKKSVHVSLVIRRVVAVSASVYGRGSMSRRAQIKQTSKQLLVQRCGLTRDRKTTPTTCTSPPPAKPVNVDFKNVCTENPPTKEQDLHFKCVRNHGSWNVIPRHLTVVQGWLKQSVLSQFSFQVTKAISKFTTIFFLEMQNTVVNDTKDRKCLFNSTSE